MLLLKIQFSLKNTMTSDRTHTVQNLQLIQEHTDYNIPTSVVFTDYKMFYSQQNKAFGNI
jgi:hypothetical protein